MELIFFIKELHKKGDLYYRIWMSILMQFDSENNQKIHLYPLVGIPKSTYYRIINFGLVLFPKYVNTIRIFKEKNCLVFTKEHIVLIEPAKAVEPETVVLKKIKKQNEEPKLDMQVYEEVIGYLNQCTGQAYKVNSKINQSLINARIREGHTVDDFKRVISTKSKKWINTKWQDFLRPQTLFGSKFESYLNESSIAVVEQTKQQKAFETANQATELGWNNQ